MPHLQLTNYRTGDILYQGNFATARACVEQAAIEGICLDYVDLRHANLAHAALDDVVMRYALLDHTNLTGANISEADLTGSSLKNATLHGACLCFSILRDCNFEDALFGGTDIAGCRLQNAQFSTFSAFSLNFIDTENLTGCTYRASNGTVCAFSRPPLVINGLAMPVILMDDHLKIGNTVRTCREWHNTTNDNIPADRPDSSYIFTFFRQHETLLRSLMDKQHGNMAGRLKQSKLA